MRQSDVEIWERIEARLRNVQWSKPKTTVRVASYDSSHVVDAYKALNRNAAAAERDKSEPRAVGRMRRPRPSLSAISEELKEEHDYVLKEREGFHIDSGMTPQCQAKEANPHCCARHAALLEVGCLEFFAHALSLPYERGMVRCQRPVVSSLFCEQCQSVGHTEAGCPFKPTDEAVTIVAPLRRERRASGVRPRRRAV
jgi:hypothetical protein